MDLSVLVGAIGIIAVSLSFRVYPDQSVGCRFSETHRLPASCFVRESLGFDCPGCGLTRSFVYFFQGNFASSLAANRCGWLLAIAVAFQIPFRIWRNQRLIDLGAETADRHRKRRKTLRTNTLGVRTVKYPLPNQRAWDLWHSRVVMLLLCVLAISWVLKHFVGV
jgi:hypothetical protein